MSASDPNRDTKAEVPLIPDREMLLQFAALMFKNADQTGFVSLRAFRDNDRRNEKPILIEAIRLDDPDFAAIVIERARQAADWDGPAVYCPPIATFKTPRNAKTDNLHEVVDLSTECDQNPQAARSKLEALLGSATAVVASGGEWTNPSTGEIEPKLHLHWRLSKPTSTRAEHHLLREARELATKLVGGDATNISIVHPIRWPGSWHRKGTPRLAKIVASSDDNEIDLVEAVERLRDASGAATFAGFGFKTSGKLEACDHAAVSVKWVGANWKEGRAPIFRTRPFAAYQGGGQSGGASGEMRGSGLRKAKMRRLAEDGASEKEIAAWSGHKTLREIERYTKAADQKRLAKAATNRKRTEIA